MKSFWKEILALGFATTMIILAVRSDKDKTASLLDKSFDAVGKFAFMKNMQNELEVA